MARVFSKLFFPLTGLLLLCLLHFATVGPAFGAESQSEKMDRARAFYEQAKTMYAALDAKPLEERTQKDYEKLIQAYRLVYLTAPTFPNNTISLMAIGELAEVLARRWSQPKYFETAINSYEFLLKEYPYTQFRFDALLSIARIYRDDLRQPEEALQQYERYLKTFPRSSQAQQAQQAAAQLRDQIGPKEPAEVASAATPAPSSKDVETVATPSAAEAKPAAEAASASAATPTSPIMLASETVTTSSVGLPSSSATASEAAASGTAKIATVSDVRYWQSAAVSRVIVAVDQKVRYVVGELDSPARLYVDLYESKVTPPVKGRTIPVGGELLKQVRLAQYKASVSRLVLDLGDKADYKISELLNPYRLVIDLTVRPAESLVSKASTPPAASVAPAAETPKQRPTLSGKAESVQPKAKPVASQEMSKVSAPPSAPVELAKAAPSDTPAKESSAKDTPAKDIPAKIKPAQPLRNGGPSLTRALGLKIGRILLDPGHGGHDTGTIGPSGYTEKELVLDIAHRLGSLIEERLGSEVAYTRADDEFIPLEERVSMANRMGADLFLSIHANSSRSRKADGIETYYLNFTSDPEALEVASRENAGSQETISNLQGLLEKIAMQEKLGESKEFASRVHTALRKSLASGKSRQFDRGVKTAPFVVLIGANMPAVLAEISFLSNPDQEKKLKSQDQRQKIAEALYSGIANYANTLSGVKVAHEAAQPAASPAGCTVSKSTGPQTASIQ